MFGLEFLLTPVGLGYVVTGLIALVAAVKKFFPGQEKKVEQIEGAVYKAFNWAEKAIPKTGDDDRLGRALSKATLFMQKFCEVYEKEHGKPPSKSLQNLASKMAEKLVFSKNLR